MGKGRRSRSATQPRSTRYATHRPTNTMPIQAVAKPIKMNISGAETISTSSDQRNANQNVRICQLKCDASQVSRT